MYRLEISQSAHRQIRRLPPGAIERINQAIAKLSEQPRPRSVKKLTALEGYRLRVGDYRVLYTVDDIGQRVVVYRVMVRAEVYRTR